MEVGVSSYHASFILQKYRQFGSVKVNKPLRLMLAILKLIRPANWKHFTRISETTSFDAEFIPSWSQAGEDLALNHFLKNDFGRFLDIGAHHPTRFSVTRHLYQRGWTGVNVEANSSLIAEFNKKRKRDTNLWKAVGSELSYELSVFEEAAISTVNADLLNVFLSEGQKIIRREVVPGIRLREIIEIYFKDDKCNLLSIDIEGADYDALKSLDLETLEQTRFPDWIMLETKAPVENALAEDSVVYARQHGYIPYVVLPMVTLLKNGK
jgi:FkbM family methyltransferase